MHTCERTIGGGRGCRSLENGRLHMMPHPVGRFSRLDSYAYVQHDEDAMLKSKEDLMMTCSKNCGRDTSRAATFSTVPVSAAAEQSSFEDLSM